MKRKNTLLIISTMALAIMLMNQSCELFDPHNPPKIQFKTGVDYTAEDLTVDPGAAITVGIIADKVEDDMKVYNISYAYDGASATTTKDSFNLTGSEQKHYEKDYTFNVRNESGKTETWYFTITDRDGNIAQLTLTLTTN